MKNLLILLLFAAAMVMPLFAITTGQSATLELYAIDQATGGPKTGDAANIAAKIAKDGGTFTATTNAVTEVDAVNAPGMYRLTLTAAETNCDYFVLSPLSATPDVSLNPLRVETTPSVVAANMTQIGGLTTYQATGVVYGTVSTAVSTTIFEVDAADFGGGALPSAITAYTGHTLQMTSGGSAGESHIITTTLWDGSTMRFTVRTGFQVAPAAGDTFVITPNRIDFVRAYNQTGEALATLAQQSSINTKVDTVDGNVDAIVAKLPSGTISDFDESTDQVALSSASQSAVVSAVFAHVVDGTITMEEAVEKLFAYAGGKWTRNSQTGVITYYLQDDITPAMTMEIVSDVSRTVTHP